MKRWWDHGGRYLHSYIYWERTQSTNTVCTFLLKQNTTHVFTAHPPKRWVSYVKHYFAIALHNTYIYKSSSKTASTIRLILFRHRSEGNSSIQLLMASNCWSATSECLRSTSSKRVNQSLMTAVELTFSTASSKCLSIKMSSCKRQSCWSLLGWSILQPLQRSFERSATPHAMWRASVFFVSLKG